MSPTEAEISAVMALAADSGVIVVPDRIKNLHRRVNSQATAVAVIGMVKRGKSTLLNRLVGVDVSAVAATPETASTIRVMTGPPSAWRSSKSGAPEEDLSAEPSKFLEQSRRAPDINRRRAAGISGKFRLPSGLVLVDTPGVGDVAAELDELYADIDEQWIEAGCGAAIVVINPGAGSYDLELFRRARSTFPGAVEVVMKATDESISYDDVCAYAEHIESDSQWGCSVLAIPDVIPDKDWGASRDFGPLENLISELGERAEARIGVDLQFYERFVDQFVAELDEVLPVDRKPIESALKKHSEFAPERLVYALERCVKKFEIAELDERATQTISEIDDRTDPVRPVLKSQFTTLEKCAQGGSEVAQTALIRFLLLYGTRLFGNSPYGDSFSRVLSCISPKEVPRLVRDMPLDELQVVNLLSSIKKNSLLREQVEEAFVERVLRLRKIDQLTEILPVLIAQSNRKRVLVEIGQFQINALKKFLDQADAAKANDLPSAGLAGLRQLVEDCQTWVGQVRSFRSSTERHQDFAQMTQSLSEMRPRALSLLPRYAMNWLGTSQLDLISFRNRLKSLSEQIAVFELSDSERTDFDRAFVSLLIEVDSPHLKTEEQVVGLSSWSNDFVVREQLLVQRGASIVLQFQRVMGSANRLDQLVIVAERFDAWEQETNDLSSDSHREQRDQIRLRMSDKRSRFAKEMAPILEASASELFTSIPFDQVAWSKRVDWEIQRIDIYLRIAENSPSIEEVRNLIPALQSASSTWIQSAHQSVSASSIRASNIHIGFGTGIFLAIFGSIFSCFVGISVLHQPVFVIGGLISCLSLLLVCGVEYSVPTELRAVAFPPPPPSPIRQPSVDKVQVTGVSDAVIQRPMPFLYFLASFGLVLCVIGVFASPKLNGAIATPWSSESGQLSTSIEGVAGDSQTTSTISSPSFGETEIQSSSTPRSGSSGIDGVLPDASVTTSRSSSSGSSTTSTTRGSISSTPTTSSPREIPTTSAPPVIIPTAANQVNSATNTGWGRYSVMVETRVTVPQGSDHRFSVSGTSAARYSSGAGTVRVSLTISVDGYFLEHPGNGPNYFLYSADQEGSKAYSYTIQLGPGTHVVQLLAYPPVPSPAVSFRAQSIRVADLGAVK